MGAGGVLICSCSLMSLLVSLLAVSSRRYGDGLVIMVKRNHIFVEDQMTRRGDLWLNRKKCYSFKCLLAHNLPPLSLDFIWVSCSRPIISTRTIIHYRWLFHGSQPDSQTKSWAKLPWSHGRNAQKILLQNGSSCDFFFSVVAYLPHTSQKNLEGPRALREPRYLSQRFY